MEAILLNVQNHIYVPTDPSCSDLIAQFRTQIAAYCHFFITPAYFEFSLVMYSE